MSGPSQSSNKNRGGRPPTWTSTVLREMIVIDLFINGRDHETIDVLRQPNDGGRPRKLESRNLYNKRNQVYGPGGVRWKPQNALIMYERVAHLYDQRAASRSCRIFSLHLTEHKLLQDFPVWLRDLDFHYDSPPLVWTSMNKLTIRTVKANGSETTLEKFRILLTRPDANHTVEVCHLWDVGGILREITGLLAGSSTALIVDLGHIDLSRHYALSHIQMSEIVTWRVVRLAINNCRLEEIPHFIRSLSSLTHLDVSRNRLTRVSATMLPPKLTHLDLRHNRILEISEDLMQLTSLRILALAYNHIKVLPPWLSDWSSLAVLLVEGNPLDLFSYFHYYQAFELRRKGSNSTRCAKCLLMATEVLKNMLSLSATQLENTGTDMNACLCAITPNFAAEDVNETFQDEARRTESAVQSTNRPIAIAFLKDHLYRLSLQSDDMRSSISAFTLRSMSPAGSDRTSFKVDKEDLLQIHCCTNRRDCIHNRTAVWLCDRAPYHKPPYQVFRADAIERDLNGNSVLHIMAALGAHSTDLMDCIEHGTDAMAVNRDGETFLHRVKKVSWDELEVAKLLDYLVGKNFNFYHQDNRGNTIFHKSERFMMAAEKADIFYVSCGPCLRNAEGIEVSVPAKSCSTLTNQHCLQYCLYETDVQSAAPIYLRTRCPIEIGSCHNECNGTTSDALHILMKMAQLGIQEFRIENYGDPLDFPTALELLLDLGAEVNNHDNYGASPLVRFVKIFGKHRGLLTDNRKEYCVSALLKAGANPAAMDRQGETALHVAIHYGLPGVAALLIGRGANVNARNGKGLSVVQVLNEALHRMKAKLALKDQRKTNMSSALKANLEQFARYEQCEVILADQRAKVNPTTAEEFQWTIEETS